eukprot:scaffold45009_cov14-Tisochrysis_lutea.AAC.1
MGADGKRGDALFGKAKREVIICKWHHGNGGEDASVCLQIQGFSADGKRGDALFRGEKGQASSSAANAAIKVGVRMRRCSWCACQQQMAQRE